jgi:hypothetical protein
MLSGNLLRPTTCQSVLLLSLLMRLLLLVLLLLLLQFYASNDPGCGLYAVGEPFETNYLSTGFPPDVPAALVQAVSGSIVRLQVRLLCNSFVTYL